MMLIADFENYIQHEKRYSVHTVTAYVKDLEQFTTYLKEKYGITDLTQSDRDIIRSWVVSLISMDVSARSVGRKLSALKTFFRMLMMEGKVKSNPAREVSVPKVRKKLPVFVERDQTEKLFTDGLFESDFSGLRDKLVLEILYTTGMRLSELINIESRDIDFRKCQVRVLGKRKKERDIPLHRNTLSLLKNYADSRDSFFDSLKTSKLLVTDKGKVLYPKFVYRLVNNYLSKVTTVTKKSPHVLRHTFATHMLNNGAELNAIKEILGHASLSATQVYTHNSIDQLKAIHKLAHPRG